MRTARALLSLLAVTGVVALLVVPGGAAAQPVTAGAAPRTTVELPEPVVQAMHAAAITILLASPESGLLASGSVDGSVKLWSLRSGELLHTLVVGRAWVRSLAFSGDGRRLAVGTGDHLVHTYDAASGALERLFTGPNSAATALAFSADGLLLAAGTSRDDRVRVWRVDSGELQANLFHRPPVRALGFARNANLLVVAGAQARSRWRIGLGRQSDELAPSDEPVTTAGQAAPSLARASDDKPMAVDAAGNTIATAQGRTIVWSRAPEPPRSAPVLMPSAVRAIRFAPDDKALVHSTSTGHLAHWDLGFGEMTEFMPNAAARSAAFANAIAFSRDGRTVTSVKDDRRSRWSWRVSSRPAPSAPAGPTGTLDGSIDTLMSLGKDIDGPVPPNAPFNLMFAGEPTVLTHAAAIASAGERVVYAGFVSPPDVLFVSAEEAFTEKKLWSVQLGKDMGRRVTAVAASPDGSAVAVAADDHRIHWLDGRTGTVKRSLPSPTNATVTVLEFSGDGRLLAGGASDGRVQIWGADGQALAAPPMLSGSMLALTFSADGSTLATGGAHNVIQLWDVQRGAVVRTLEGHSSAVTALAYSHRGSILASGSEDATVRIWNSADGQLLASTSANAVGNWLVMSPQGFFDGTRQSWRAVPFRFRSAPDRLYRPEQFFNQFFQPGLLADVVQRQSSILTLLRERSDKRAELNIAAYARSQLPLMQMQVLAAAEPVKSRSVQVKVSATDSGSGVRDLRVFRNGSLVKFVHGELRTDPSTRRYDALIPVEVTAGANEISAYAFNDDDLKSEDATVMVTGASSLARKGSAYIIAVGVNRHDNAEFDLHYAAPDAGLVGSALKASLARLGTYANIESIALTNEQATKRNVLDALKRLAGDEPELDPLVASRLLRIHRTGPEDIVIVYFSGHGAAANDRYFLLPHDTGYKGPRQHIDAAGWEAIFSHSISDRDLNAILERIDAAQMMLVIDACHSGHVLESEESRRGPLNARGIAQLAYEKGAYVLAASQSNQAALELQRLGHGVLTYTLIEKGLKAYAADADDDGRVTAAEWFHYAGEQVPIELAAIASAQSASARPITVGGQPVTAQRPRSYYRRDRPDDWPLALRGR